MRLGIIGAGAIGSVVGVKTPVNDAVVELMNSFPVGTLKPDPENLDPLVRRRPG